MTKATAPAFRRSVLTTTTSDSLITRYYRGVRLASEAFAGPGGSAFAPAFDYPGLTETWERFFSVAGASWDAIGEYGGKSLILLDLMKNPAARTTKTTASLLMVARAIQHIRRTGEAIMLFTPSSGNKAAALRDAVARALELGLAEPDELRITTLTPSDTLYKFRRNLLTESAELRRLNPFLVYPGSDRAAVEALGRTFVGQPAAEGERTCRLWYSLDIANYQVAGACRAFFEHEFGQDTGARRVHAHAVSSAYGLLGYQHGLDVLAGLGVETARPGYLLVQHLATSDMVTHYLREATGEDPRPRYEQDGRTGLLRQDVSPHFPARTWAADENLEPTFYTKNPPTAPEMTGYLLAQGGTGIVVSLHECLERYGAVRRQLAGSGGALPADPRELGEWSLTMALTGVFNAIDRELLGDFDEVVVHGSGTYRLPGPDSVLAEQTTTVTGAEDLLNLFSGALTRSRRQVAPACGSRVALKAT